MHATTGEARREVEGSDLALDVLGVVHKDQAVEVGHERDSDLEGEVCTPYRAHLRRSQCQQLRKGLIIRNLWGMRARTAASDREWCSSSEAGEEEGANGEFQHGESEGLTSVT